MTKTEFMEVLQRTLAGSLGSGTVSGHMRYYQDYFDSQLAMGKDEMQITAELGDPRLLAKTIIEAAKREGMGGGTPEYDEVYEDGTADPKGNGRVKAYRMPVWLVAVLVFMVCHCGNGDFRGDGASPGAASRIGGSFGGTAGAEPLILGI